MDAYIIPIKTAFIIFPLIALVFTLPYIFIQYRKYGSIPSIKSLIIYSLILYLINLYFLVVLPLPPIEEVAKLTTPIMNLVPFSFVKDIYKQSTITLTQTTDLFEILTQFSILQVFFNILLFVPLGIYLRYYFKYSFKKIIIISFGLSLFCELSQLTSLYGLYPRPYRLFEVDDLIINTFGGCIGYWIAPLFAYFLPSIDKINNYAYKKGQAVTLIRVLFACIIDWCLIEVSCFCFLLIIKFAAINITFDATLLYGLKFFIYFVVLQYWGKGYSIGKKIMRFKLVSENGSKLKVHQLLIRYFLLYGLILMIPALIIECLMLLFKAPFIIEICLIIIVAFLILTYVFFIIEGLGFAFKFKKQLFYAKLSKTTYQSVILFEEKPILEEEKLS